RIVVDAARASKLPSLTTEQRAEWGERAEVWANTAADEFANDLVALLSMGASGMAELTPEMHAAMGQAILRARRYLIDNFPREGEWLLTTAIAVGFADMLRNSTPAGQAALVAAANDKLEGTRWRLVERTN